MAIDFAYGRTRLADIRIHGVRSIRTGRLTITGLTVDGQLAIPTRAFWDELFTRFRLTGGWARGKSDARRFEWLLAHFGDREIPYRIEWNSAGECRLLPYLAIPDRMFLDHLLPALRCDRGIATTESRQTTWIPQNRYLHSRRLVSTIRGK